MTNVSFEEEQGMPSVAAAKPRGFAAVLIRWGIVQDQIQANLVLLLLAVFFTGSAAYIVIAGKERPYVLTPQEQLEAKRMETAGIGR